MMLIGPNEGTFTPVVLPQSLGKLYSYVSFWIMLAFELFNVISKCLKVGLCIQKKLSNASGVDTQIIAREFYGRVIPCVAHGQSSYATVESSTPGTADTPRHRSFSEARVTSHVGYHIPSSHDWIIIFHATRLG